MDSALLGVISAEQKGDASEERFPLPLSVPCNANGSGLANEVVSESVLVALG